jgi:hypothetical protein
VMRTIIDYQNNFQRPEIVVAVKAADLWIIKKYNNEK